MNIATSDTVSDVELFRDVFGDTDDCEWHASARERGFVRVCAGEWRRESDGSWRLFIDDQADE